MTIPEKRGADSSAWKPIATFRFTVRRAKSEWLCTVGLPGCPPLNGKAPTARLAVGASEMALASVQRLLDAPSSGLS